MGYFLGIDLGTSYFKAGLFDADGSLKGLGRLPVNKETGKANSCELPVPVFLNTLYNCIGKAIKSAGISSREILALSYSSQANSFILLNGNDIPLTPLILWPDKRAKDTSLVEKVFGNDPELFRRTGLGSVPGREFSITKMNRLQKEEPRTWERLNSLLSISDYLSFLLTGNKFSDVSTASLSGLLDVTECNWISPYLESFSIDQESLPSLCRTGSLTGTLTKTGAELFGLCPGIACYAGALDHHCAAIGAGLPANNYISESTGTVLSCVSYTNFFHPVPMRFIAPGLTPGHYFQMAFNDNGAKSLEWYREKFAPELSIAGLLELAGRVEKGCGGLKAKSCVFQYEGKKGFENVKPGHTHGHFIRAILESVSVSLAGLVDSVKYPGVNNGVISTGGGAQSRLWTEIKAETLKTKFFLPECNETACLGAALIAAHGTKNFGDWNEIINKWVKFAVL